MHSTAQLWLAGMLLLVPGIPVVLLTLAWLGRSRHAWGFRHELALGGEGPFRAARVTIATRALPPPLVLVPATLVISAFATATPVLAVLIFFGAADTEEFWGRSGGYLAALTMLGLITFGTSTCAMAFRVAWVILREPRIGATLLRRWLLQPVMLVIGVVGVLLIEITHRQFTWDPAMRTLGWSYVLLGALAVIGWMVALDAVQRRMTALRDPRRPGWSTRPRQESAEA